MKKIICIIMAMAFVLIPLNGCNGAGGDGSETSESTVESDKVSAAVSENSSDPYPINYTEDERITAKNDKKSFNDGKIAFEYPANWSFAEQKGEDGSFISFRAPELGGNCQFSVYITASELYVHDNTEEEYITSLSEDYQDISIKEFAKDKIDGHEATKVVASCSSSGTEFKRLMYDNIIEDIRLYNFDIIYPLAENETYEIIFDEIIASIKLMSKD